LTENGIRCKLFPIQEGRLTEDRPIQSESRRATRFLLAMPIGANAPVCFRENLPDVQGIGELDAEAKQTRPIRDGTVGKDRHTSEGARHVAPLLILAPFAVAGWMETAADRASRLHCPPR